MTEVENNKRKSSTTWILPVLTRIFKLQPDDDLVQSLTLPDQKAVDIGFAFSSPLTIAVEFQKEAPRRSNAAAGSDVLGAPPGSAVFEKGAPTRCNAAAEPAAPARRMRQKQQPPGGAVTAPEAEAAAPPKSSGKAAAKTKGRGKGRGKNKGPAAEPASASQPAAPAEPNQRDGPAEPAGKKRRIIVPSGVELGCSKCYHNTEVGCTTCRPKAGLVKISAQEWGWPPAAAAAAD